MREEGNDYANSPLAIKKRSSHRDSQRNYFRRDQDNKNLVNSLKKSDAVRILHDDDSSEAGKKEDDELEQHRRGISKLDQTLGGNHEHHGSRHQSQPSFADEVEQQPYEDAEHQDAINASQQWHEVNVVKSETGS